MGDEKSGSSDVEVDNNDNDSVFSDPHAPKATVTPAEQQLLHSHPPPKPVEIGSHINAICVTRSLPLPPQQSNLVTNIAKAMAVHPTGFLVSQSPHSPHILINPGVPTITPNQYVRNGYMHPSKPMIQTSLIPGQLIQTFPGSPHLTQTQLHPATYSRLEDAKAKNLLNVYCNSSSDGKKISATLDKTLFGSGSRGACIRFTGKMLTPRQFEIECQLEQSRDWRRSIHCQGDTLKDLIKQGVLRPHAQSCVCNICSPDPASTNSAAPKYEEEVTQRRKFLKEKRNASAKSESAKKRPRPSVFFPSSDTASSATPSSMVPSTPTRSLQQHPLFQSSLFSSFEQTDKANLRALLQQFDQQQVESTRRTKLLDDKIQKCEKQLQQIKESAIEERISSQDRENQLFNLLSALTDSVDRSESRRVSRRASIITPTGPLIPNGTPIVYRDELTDQIKNGPPHSAPPESPIRAILVNPDRRRTSSDTSVGRSKLPPHQQCSNVKCERIAQWRCIGCEKAIYCGKECQETHWTNGHEDECDGEDRDK